MDTWLLVFIISGLILLILLFLKGIQEKFHLLLFWPNQRHHIEHFLNRIVVRFKAWYKDMSERRIYIILHKVLMKIGMMFTWVQMKIDRKSARLTRVISGKRDVAPEGKASHFLYDIRSFKDTFNKE